MAETTRVNVLSRVVGVEFPGFVKNVDKMLEAIGGMTCLNNTFNHETARLELRFRPKDPYSHSAFGDRVSTNNLLVKCIRKKKTDKDGNITFVYETSVVGIIDTTYRFQSIVDFQYLPMIRTNDQNTSKPRFKSILEEILPENPFLPENKCWNYEAPLFVVPTIFSRFDSPSDYFYRNDPKYRDVSVIKEVERQNRSSIIGRTRKSRSTIACLLNWTDEIPKEPHSSVIENASKYHPSEKLAEEVKKCFELRPIWSRNALMYKLKCVRQDLKFILPCVAYYFINGPFRCMWIKFGYDPRKDKASKVYQTLDFRVKQTYAKSNSSERILAKRSIYQYQLPLRKNDIEKSRNRYRASVIEHDSFVPSSSGSNTNERDRDEKLFASFAFRPGLMPAYRQLFYQLCDIKVDQIQKLIHSNDGKEPEVCDEKDGWCIPGAIEQIRSIMSSIVDDMLAKDNATVSISKENLEEEDVSEDEYLDYVA